MEKKTWPHYRPGLEASLSLAENQLSYHRYSRRISLITFLSSGQEEKLVSVSRSTSSLHTVVCTALNPSFLTHSSNI